MDQFDEMARRIWPGLSLFHLAQALRAVRVMRPRSGDTRRVVLGEGRLSLTQTRFDEVDSLVGLWKEDGSANRKSLAFDVRRLYSGGHRVRLVAEVMKAERTARRERE